jgi:hypothetical protein
MYVVSDLMKNIAQDKPVLVEPTEDFTLCDIVREVCVLKQAPASLFPVVEVQLRCEF